MFRWTVALTVCGVVFAGCDVRKAKEVDRGDQATVVWSFESLLPAVAVGLESDRSFARGERLFGERCGRCHALEEGKGGLSDARARLSFDEWVRCLTGGDSQRRCAGCVDDRALKGLEQAAALDLLAVLVHGNRPADPAFQGVGR